MTIRLDLYGIPNCTTVKKARAWLVQNRLDHRFHDFKKQGLASADLLTWEAALGWERLLKKTGPTWRALPEERKAGLTRETVLVLLREYPNLIRRPIAVLPDGRVLAGFDEADYAAAFSAAPAPQAQE